MAVILTHSAEPIDSSLRRDEQFGIVSAEEIIEEARAGRMFILVDDEERENEGDLVIPAQMATPSVINFMATHGRGLICLALTKERVEHLGLSLMSRRNGSRHETAFTVSIEAREGVTTGISAADRAHTIAVAIDSTKKGDQLVSPGHVFPLMARDGGVLIRAGHTEAAVDVSRLAGLNPSGVICEIMNDDGTMARLPDLMRFAQRHKLKIGTIKDLIAYRRRRERLIECKSSSRIVSRFGGEFEVRVYASKLDGREIVALVKGNIGGLEPVLVRVHPYLPSIDVLGEVCARTGQLERAMTMIGEEGRGVLVFVREWQGLASYFGDENRSAVERHPIIKDYGPGAQVLSELGVTDMILLTNSRPAPHALEGYGLRIAGFRMIPDLQTDGFPDADLAVG